LAQDHWQCSTDPPNSAFPVRSRNMPCRALSFVLLLITRLSPICTSIKVLASRAEETYKAKQHLRLRTSQLLQALRQELGDETPIPVLVVAARNLLGEEANGLQDEDRIGAQRLRQYAIRLTPSTFVLAPSALADPERLETAFTSRFGLNNVAENTEVPPEASSMSEETVIQSDGDGNAVARVTRCQDGMCEQRTDFRPVSGNEMRGEGHRNILATSAHQSSGRSAAKSETRRAHRHAGRRVAARRVARQMAKAMRNMEEDFGSAGLDSMLDDLLASKGIEGNATAAESVSSSSTTRIENGRIVQKTTECKNGKCTTSVNKGTIEDDSNDRQISPAEHRPPNQKEQDGDGEADASPPTQDAAKQNEIILSGSDPISYGGARKLLDMPL